jgi:uncharacterized protein YndB with AHSA1/START domain
MTIAPLVRTVTVKAPPERAFALFTNHAERWWPASHHIGKQPFAAIVMEPRAGGRWFERDAQGLEYPWGEVMAWDPPGRILLAWRLNRKFDYDPNFSTEVELTFEPDGAGTRVTLEHRHLERFGADAAQFAASLNGGWTAILEGFAASTTNQPQKEPAS